MTPRFHAWYHGAIFPLTSVFLRFRMPVHMENHIRIFRKQPFGWFDKPIMRYLRETYGGNKKVFIALRATYLAICEMESDFGDTPVAGFNKTVGTYAGLTRQVAGKYVRLLEKEGLIQKTRVIDAKTGLKSKGT